MQTSEQQTREACLTYSGDECEYDIAVVTCPECHREVFELDGDYGICIPCLIAQTATELALIETSLRDTGRTGDAETLALAIELLTEKRG